MKFLDWLFKWFVFWFIFFDLILKDIFLIVIKNILNFDKIRGGLYKDLFVFKFGLLVLILLFGFWIYIIFYF